MVRSHLAGTRSVAVDFLRLLVGGVVLFSAPFSSVLLPHGPFPQWWPLSLLCGGLGEDTSDKSSFSTS
jgi:hypothetical protein